MTIQAIRLMRFFIKRVRPTTVFTQIVTNTPFEFTFGTFELLAEKKKKKMKTCSFANREVRGISLESGVIN